MRKFFLISAVLLSATAAHAASDPTAAGADQPTASASSAQAPDASAMAAKRQAMIQQQMAMQKQIAMQKQMAIQREMQLHPIRTRVHFALLKFERKLHRAF